MDGIEVVILNGIFGLCFAIIGYFSATKAAKIKAGSDQQKNNEKEPFVFPSNYEDSQSVADKKNPEFSWTQIHWQWWAIYSGILFAIALIPFAFINFISLIIFIFIGIPVLTIWLAILHPIPWKYAVVFIVFVYVSLYIRVMSLEDMYMLYTDLYEDIPLWAWSFANIAGVIVISIQREQSNSL